MVQDLQVAKNQISKQMKPPFKRACNSAEEPSSKSAKFEPTPVKTDVGVPSHQKSKRASDEDAEEPSGKIAKVEVKEEEDATLDGVGPVEAKEEPMDDAEEPTTEVMMNKAQLEELHGLKRFPKGHQGKANPMYCKHCDKIFEGRNRAKVWQHVRGQDHRAKWGRQSNKPESAQVKVENDELPADSYTDGHCSGLKLGSSLGQSTRLGSDLAPVWKEFAAYRQMQASTPCGESTHVYEHLVTENDWIIRHCKCQKQDAVYTGDDGWSTCKICLSLGNDQKFLTRASQFVADLDEARLLFHRMYKSEVCPEFIKTLKEKNVYQRRCKTNYDRFIDFDLPKLHASVRSKWVGRKGRQTSDAMGMLMAHVVLPCIDVEPSYGLKEANVDRLLKFMSNDENSNPKDLEIVKSIVTGQVSRNPALHGIMVALMTQFQNMESGKTTMRNPNRRDERERNLLLEAGAELAAMGCNDRALAFFGLKWIEKKRWQGSLAQMSEWSLPIHTSPSASQIAENDHTCSLILASDQGPRRRLVLAFDRTYLDSTMQLGRTSVGHVMLGGVHRPRGFNLESEDQIPLKAEEGGDQFIHKDISKANEIESCLVWDPTRKHGPTLELAAFPVNTAASKDSRFEAVMPDTKTGRGNWETFARIGEVLDQAPSVKYIVADSHGSHEWIRRKLLGQSVPIPDSLVQQVPFFSKLAWSDLPEVPFPLPYRLVSHPDTGQTIHCVPRPAHLQKNFAEQLRSPLRCIHFGSKFTDFSAALDLGLFPVAFIGTDSMSDWQAALLLSPLNFVVDPCQSPVIIPWALEGAFLMSLIGAHVNASVLHGNLCRKWRLEVAFTGSWAECHLIMFSKHLQQPPKYPSTQVWLDGTTHRNLKDALGSVILILWSQDVPPLWWHRLTERNLEKRFGRCRQFFPNSQMSVGDYWRSSARIMRQDVKSFDAKREEQLPAPQPLSKNDFQEIAVRSLKAAMRLSSMCSGCKLEDLQSDFKMMQHHVDGPAVTTTAEEASGLLKWEVVTGSAADTVERLRASQALAQNWDDDALDLSALSDLACIALEEQVRKPDACQTLKEATQEGTGMFHFGTFLCRIVQWTQRTIRSHVTNYIQILVRSFCRTMTKVRIRMSSSVSLAQTV
ncbi:unnamed protein product [Durusdinium trenchii]|uniref:Uncharacterized protein n=1 Tax=Durusdinium trenchii TaxID=1381693 RepID=A0ABP0SDT1_9DINO